MSRPARDEYELYKARRRRSSSKAPEFGARDFDRLLRRLDQLYLRSLERGLTRDETRRLHVLRRLLEVDCDDDMEGADEACEACCELEESSDSALDGDTSNEPTPSDTTDGFDSPADAGLGEVGPAGSEFGEVGLAEAEFGDCQRPVDALDAGSLEPALDDNGAECMPWTNYSRLGCQIPSSRTRRDRWRIVRRGSRT